MDRFQSTVSALLTLAAAAFAAGCGPAEPAEDEVIGIDDLEMTIDEALDDVEASTELAGEVEEPADDQLLDLDVAPEDEGLDRAARRELVRRIVVRLAQEEPCALRGVLAGRYARIEDAEDEIDADGLFRGRAFRRNRRLVAVGEGTWTGNDGAPGGSFEGRYENFEGNHGAMTGEYLPDDLADDDRLGTFAGTWAPEDASHEGGNLGGVWHPTRDGRGVFLGYWSRCDATPVHTEDAPVL